MKDKCDKIKGGDTKREKEKKDKVKKEKDKGKKKESSAAHPTMLSTLLSKRSNVEYTMVAGVIDNVSKDDLVLATHSVNELACLVEDAGTRGVLDCGCSKTVVGVKWLDKYNKKLPVEVAASLKVERSERVYQFGGGETRSSRGCVSLPTMIGDKKVSIKVEIVEAEIPLLIGSNSMQAAKALLDFGEMKAVFFEEEIQMYKVGSGLFCIDLMANNMECHINDTKERDTAVEQALLVEENIDEKTLKRLHHVFGHTSVEKLRKFVEKTGKLDQVTRKLLEKIGKNCDACIKCGRKKPRPKAAIPRVDKPNQIVTVDLKDYDTNDPQRRYICYFIDMHSRLTLGDFIPDKKPEQIVEVLVSKWIHNYGMMGGLHSDIGGEMSNKILEDVAANLTIKPTTTAAYSPHQNGINERNQAENERI